MSNKLLVVFIILLSAFRLWLSAYTKHGDLHNYWNWAQNLTAHGLVDFYDLPRSVFWPQSRPNQPAGSIYTYTGGYMFNKFVDQSLKNINSNIQIFPSALVWWWEARGDLVSLKLSSIIADLAIFFAILKFGQYSNLAKLVGLIYLVNPPLWYNSSLWGQNDSIVAALAIWAVISILSPKPVLAGILLGASLATKASWIPILLPFLVYLIKQPKNLIKFIISISISSLFFFVPFHPQINLPFWLTRLYLERLLPGESPYITVNAFNFWHLFFPLDKTPDTVSFLGFPANSVSLLLLLLLLLFVIRRFLKDLSPAGFLSSSLILYFGFFMFAARMHERYMYPLFPLMSLLLVSGYRLWLHYALLSFTYLANQYSMWFAPTIPQFIALYTPLFTKSLSLTNLGVFVLLWYSMAHVGKPRRTST